MFSNSFLEYFEGKYFISLHTAKKTSISTRHWTATEISRLVTVHNLFLAKIMHIFNEKKTNFDTSKTYPVNIRLYLWRPLHDEVETNVM